MSDRVLAVGDVHGCVVALRTTLSRLHLSDTDTIVFLGDAVDRGPSSKAVVEEILSLQNVCRVIFVMGNHEEMMRDAISGRGLWNQWLDVGGKATLDSYGGSVEDIPSSHIKFLLSGRAYFETENDIYVHASLEPEMSMPNQTVEFLRWKHLGGSERAHFSGKRVICGHTTQTDGIPFVANGWVCIDTGPHIGKWLSCLDVGTNQVVQSTESGESRTFHLSEYS